MIEILSKPSMLSVVVLGASGDLAVKKIFPALFSLYCRRLLPASFHCYGFARTEMSESAFRQLLMSHLTCRYTPGETECHDLMEAFSGIAATFRATTMTKPPLSGCSGSLKNGNIKTAQPNVFFTCQCRPSFFCPHRKRFMRPVFWQKFREPCNAVLYSKNLSAETALPRMR